VATMNPDYEGTKPLNFALKDRFRVIYLEYNDAVEKKLNIDTKMLDVAKKLRDSEEIFTPISTRGLLFYTEDVKTYGDKVARACFMNKFDTSEQPVVKEILELILDNIQPITGDENENNAEQDEENNN